MWHFEGEPLPQETKKAIVDFAIAFYKDLAKRVNEYVVEQSKKGPMQVSLFA
jgi:hypothetical protein